MAAAKTVKRTTKGTRRGATKTRRATTASRSKSNSPSRLVNILVPLVFMGAILTCLGFILLMGYRTVTASSFFDAKTIEIEGNARISRGDIEKIVQAEVGKNGVWNAELEEIKGDLEKMSYIKTAVVSRVLPNGIQVRINERVPRAIVRLDSGDYWVDEDAVILGAVGKNEPRAFAMRGWDETKSEKAQKDNQNRVQLYIRLKNDWQDAGISKRVSAVNLADMQDVQATIEGTGSGIPVSLGKDDFNRRLQKALEVVERETKPVESLISNGSNVIAKYKNS
jgi:cell division protein FtsQ